MAEETDDPASEAESTREVPADVVAEIERLSRLAREAVDDAEAEAYRRERATLAAEYGYEVRVREEDHDVLVLYPEEWVEDGTVQMEQVEDVDRGIERPLSGPGDAEDWADVEAHNAAVVERVREAHGDVHAENADAFATYMSNHLARPLETATKKERERFLDEYFPRNAWPSERQRDAVEESVSIAIEVGRELTGSAE